MAHEVQDVLEDTRSTMCGLTVGSASGRGAVRGRAAWFRGGCEDCLYEASQEPVVADSTDSEAGFHRRWRLALAGRRVAGPGRRRPLAVALGTCRSVGGRRCGESGVSRVAAATAARLGIGRVRSRCPERSSPIRQQRPRGAAPARTCDVGGRSEEADGRRARGWRFESRSTSRRDIPLICVLCFPAAAEAPSHLEDIHVVQRYRRVAGG